jgi:hypothetical protein
VRDPKVRLLDAIAAIERHRGRDKAAFERDELLQVWFLRHLQIIGFHPTSSQTESWFGATRERRY